MMCRPAGMPAPFYATLSWTQYQQARAQTALTIAQTMQPDYLVVVEEPSTEANNSGQSQANTPTGSASLLSQILASVEQAGVPGMKVGAGTSASQANAVSFIQQYVAQPVDFIDFHIYPVNLNFLPVALNIASTAAAAGKPVAMTECWLWKIADSEVGVLTADQARARNPFSFWAPLDAYFIQTMQNLAQHTQMLFMDPFITSYYAAYLPYNSSMDNLTPGAILSQENAQENLNQQDAIYTSTAMSYYTLAGLATRQNSSIDSHRSRRRIGQPEYDSHKLGCIHRQCRCGGLLRVAQRLACRHHSQPVLSGFRARGEHHVYLHHRGLRPGRKRLGLLPPAQRHDQGYYAAQHANQR